MPTTRFLKIAVVVLLILNIATLTYIFFAADRRTTTHRESSPRHVLANQLTLTEQQQANYEELRTQHKRQVRSLRREMMSHRRDMFNLLMNPRPNPLAADSLAKAIAQKQREIELTTFNHFREVKAMLSEEQKANFNEFIHEMAKVSTRSPQRWKENRNPSED